jgi:succinylglutamate desuccinylase
MVMDLTLDPPQTRSPWRRTIGSHSGAEPGPVVICVCGIHGNEPAGARAAERVLERLASVGPRFRGEFVAVAGNLAALERGCRFVEKDLNRQWTAEHLAAHERAAGDGGEGASGGALSCEDREQLEMWRTLEEHLRKGREGAYFIDLHTSSADGPPFATMGDTLRNRSFVTRLGLPIILGLEDQIDGALLEYVNNLGHVTVGIEAGRHDRPASIDLHESVLWLGLVAAGCLDPGDVEDLDVHRARIARAAEGIPQITEIRHRHAITEACGFRMAPGFQHFQPVRKGEVLATDVRGPVVAKETGVVLLPLYQVLGDDGFFLGREVHPFWLKVSAVLRKLGLPAWSHLLPGVSRHPGREDTLIVDTRIARIYPLDLFHLLGYRKRRWQGNVLMVTRRREEMAQRA